MASDREHYDDGRLCCAAELQAQRKRRKILSGDGVDPTHIEHLDTQQKGETELWEEQKDSSELAESAVQQPGGEKKPVDTAHGELEEDRQPTDGQHEGEREAGIIWQRDDRGLCDHFECELTAAKEKFSQRRANNGGGGGVKLKPSFGHRAGFDAFMTGYSFASIAVSLRKATESSGLGGERDSGGPGGEGEGNGLVGEREHRLLDELREMRNKLANRGKTFPLHILKSHFTNTSQPHRTAQLNIKEYFNKQWTNNHKKQCTNVQNTLSEI